MSFLIGKSQPAMKKKKSLFWGGAESFSKVPAMNQNALLLYGNPTPSDFDFMIEDSLSFSSSTSSTRSDAQSAPQDLSQTVSRLFREMLEEIGADLPSNWSPEEWTRLVLGEEEMLDPSYLSDVYSNLLECGFHSCYWEQAFDYLTLLYGFR